MKYSEQIKKQVEDLFLGIRVLKGTDPTREEVLELENEKLAKAYDSAMEIVHKLIEMHI